MSLRPGLPWVAAFVLALPLAVRADSPRSDESLPQGAFRIGRPGMRHAERAFAVAFAPDGKTLASAGEDRLIRLWDAATGKELRTFAGHTDSIYALAFSPDGRTLASTSEDGTGRLWNVESGKEGLVFRGDGTTAVSGLAIAPDGKSVATRGDDCTIRLWDAASGKQLHSFRSQKGVGVFLLAFAPGGKILAGIGASGGIVIWDAKSGAELRRFTGPVEDDFTSLDFSPDGKQLVSGNLDGVVRFWDVQKGKYLRDLDTLRGQVTVVRFSPDGKVLAAGTTGSVKVRLWDAHGKKLRDLEGDVSAVADLTFRADGKMLATASSDRRVRLWDPATGQELSQSMAESVTAATLSGDGKLLATGHGDGTIRFWDAATGNARPTTIKTSTNVRDLSFGADETTIAARSLGLETVGIWDVATGKRLCEIENLVPAVSSLDPDERSPVGTVALSPDGTVLVSVNITQEVLLYDAKSGRTLKHAPLKTEEEKSAVRVAFAPDGMLAVGYANCHVLFWSLTTGRVVRKIVTPNGLPTGLAFSPDGRCFATASGAGGVHLWELASEQERTADGPANERPAVTVALSADRRLLFSAGPDGVVRLADIWTRREVKALHGHRGAVTALAVAGRRLMTLGTDGTAVVWDIAGLKLPKREVTKLTPTQVAALWDDLAGGRASDGYRALGRAVAAGPQAVAVLHQRLEKSAGVDAKRLASLIADLDADEFESREKATKELQDLGTQAVPALRKALDGSTSAEVRQRAEGILKKIDGPEAIGQQLRAGRALEALEAIGSPEAFKALEALAKRGANDDLAKEARAALERLGRRAAP